MGIIRAFYGADIEYLGDDMTVCGLCFVGIAIYCS